MAQTKKQKQQKTLRYWESELEKRKIRGMFGYSIKYAEEQIRRLKNKLNPTKK